jgi:hypothetical protein
MQRKRTFKEFVLHSDNRTSLTGFTSKIQHLEKKAVGAAIFFKLCERVGYTPNVGCHPVSNTMFPALPTRTVSAVLSGYQMQEKSWDEKVLRNVNPEVADKQQHQNLLQAFPTHASEFNNGEAERSTLLAAVSMQTNVLAMASKKASYQVPHKIRSRRARMQFGRFDGKRKAIFSGFRPTPTTHRRHLHRRSELIGQKSYCRTSVG